MTLWIGTGTSAGSLLIILLLLALLARYLMLRYRRVLDQVDVDKFRLGTIPHEKEAVAAEILNSTGPDPLGSVIESEVTENGADVETCLEESVDPMEESPPGQWVADVDHKPFGIQFEISRSKFHVDKKRLLGSGEYGKVYAGTANLNNESKAVPVAIKVPKRNCPETILKGMLKELKIMTYLKHENLVSLIRANTARVAYGQLFILMELCEEGSLESFFERTKYDYAEAEGMPKALSPSAGYQELPKMGFRDLLRWCEEVATGMEYLASKGVVHRDLAARNVLLTKTWKAKVSDFGLSRQLYGNLTYEQQSQEMRLPYRWMAVECFTGIFSTCSDVWAFGVLAWEIFSLGELPYTNIEVTEPGQFADLLRRGVRISERHRATPKIFAMLEECWNEDPLKRPSLTELKEFFSGLCGLQNVGTIIFPK